MSNPFFDRIPALVLLAGVVLAGAGTVRGQGPGRGGAVPVEFVTVQSTRASVTAERVGVVRASRVADVYPRVTGFLAQRPFVEGQKVELGDVLFQIEPDVFEVEAQARRAEMMDAEARLELARTTLGRLQALRKSETVPQDSVDQAQAEALRAEAMVAKMQADLRAAELDLGYTRIVAPVSGTVGIALKDVGDLVDTGTNNHLTTITRTQPIYVTYGISEREFVEVGGARSYLPSSELSFSLVLANGERLDETGRLNYVSSDFAPDTGMLTIRIEFPNTRELLKPNQFVRIIEERGTTTYLSVPKPAVMQNPAGATVFVINEENIVESRPVTLGDWAGDDWIVLSGLAEGDRVIVEGFMKAHPGTVVSPRPWKGRQGEQEVAVVPGEG